MSLGSLVITNRDLLGNVLKRLECTYRYIFRQLVMVGRKKKVYLTNSEKVRILEEIKSGVSNQVIENKYNICKSFRRKIVQHADEITAKANAFEFKNRKMVRSTKTPKLETAVLKWFIQKRDSGQPISAAMLQEKARVFNEMLKESPTFKVSS